MNFLNYDKFTRFLFGKILFLKPQSGNFWCCNVRVPKKFFFNITSNMHMDDLLFRRVFRKASEFFLKKVIKNIRSLFLISFRLLWNQMCVCNFLYNFCSSFFGQKRQLWRVINLKDLFSLIINAIGITQHVK